jgi:hypothetical protein
MAVVKPPPFSQRRAPDDAAAVSYVDFDWLPYEHVDAL